MRRRWYANCRACTSLENEVAPVNEAPLPTVHSCASCFVPLSVASVSVWCSLWMLAAVPGLAYSTTSLLLNLDAAPDVLLVFCLLGLTKPFTRLQPFPLQRWWGGTPYTGGCLGGPSLVSDSVCLRH